MKTKKLKLYLGASFLAFFASFFLLSCVGCGGVKKNDQVLEEKSSHKGLVENEMKNSDNSSNQNKDVPQVSSDTIPLKRESPYLSSKVSTKNFIKEHSVDAFTIPIHLTGTFGWSSEKEQRTIYTTGYRPPLFIKEIYPGIMLYTKWNSLGDADNLMTVEDKIEFYDENGKLVNFYDVDKQNPYLQKYPDIVNHFYNSEGRLIDKKAINADTILSFRNSTSSIYIDEDFSFTHVAYTLWNSNQNGNIIDFHTTYRLLDSLGNQITEISSPELMYNEAYVTPDGRYLALVSGGLVDINNFGNDLNGYAKYKIFIYDTNSNKVVYKNESNYTDGVRGGWGDPYLISFRLREKEDAIIEGTRYFIDPHKRIEYSRVFTYKELGDLSKSNLFNSGTLFEYAISQYDFTMITF